MINQASRKIVSLFIANGIIKKADQEMYVYSFEILLATTVNFLLLIVFSLLSKSVVETLFYFLGFIPLRIFAGGYHAKTHLRCTIILMVSYLMFIILIRTNNSSLYNHTSFALLSISLLIIFMFSPVEDDNNPLTKSEKLKFKKTSRLCIFFFGISIIASSIIFKNSIYIFSLSIGIFSVALSITASLIKKIMLHHSQNQRLRR